MTARTAKVIVASTRAASGSYRDETGPLIATWLRDRGYSTPDPVVIADGPAVAVALREALTSATDVVITTGGTGISPTDGTPEETKKLLETEIPGIVEAIRARGAVTTATAVLTRGHAGIAGRSFVLNLPGSVGGVRDGLAVLDGVLTHILDQMGGRDHG